MVGYCDTLTLPIANNPAADWPVVTVSGPHTAPVYLPPGTYVSDNIARYGTVANT